MENRFFDRLRCRMIFQPLFLGLAIVSTVACATSEVAEAESQTIGITSLVDIVPTITANPNSGDTVANPFLLVKFDDQNGTGPLCPVEVLFVFVVHDQSGGTQVVKFPTGVPVAPPGGKEETVRWVAFDKDLNLLTPRKDFYFGVTFDPFMGSRDGMLISELALLAPSLPLKAYIAGPARLRDDDLIPKGVDFKYTVVRLEKNGTDFEIFDQCKPLDPVIRVI